MTAVTRLVSLVAVLLFCVESSVANAAEPTSGYHSCFLTSQFENWKAPDPKTIYIRVGLTRYYRLDMSSQCRSLTWPGAFLITKFRGSNSVCTALDWDIKVVDGPHGIPIPCIVKTMTELTPAEAAAIPKKFKP